MDTKFILSLCGEMQQKGYKYVCFDAREFSAHTDVSESLCLSETPSHAFTFFQNPPDISLNEEHFRGIQYVIFAVDMIKTGVVDFRDPSMRLFTYKEDDTDLGYDPIPKYFWRGIASKLNVSGVSIDEVGPDERVFFKHSVMVWRGAIVNQIKILKLSGKTEVERE